MLESLVSSRIRRALLEHILLYPTTRFQLRGLAKELHLSITPLRRELKRLETAEVLHACQEGNMLVYTVNTQAPAYQQIKQAGLGTIPETSHTAAVAMMESPAAAPAATGRVIPVGIISSTSVARSARRPLRGPVLIGVVTVGLALFVIIVALGYLTMTHEHLMAQAIRLLTTRKAQVTVVMPPPSSSGTMRGSRWQIVPGGFGGFSSGTDTTPY